MNRLADIYLGTTHSQIVYDPLGHKTNMLWENITHISGIANPKFSLCGASGDRLRGDMNLIMDLHEKQFQGKDIHQWHVYNGIAAKFPSHYLYHNATSVLYYYTPTHNSIYIRKVKSYKDLYRNLGF